MAVESLECCLSRAIGSSCTGETPIYSSEEPGCPPQGHPTAAARPAHTSIPIPAGLSLRTQPRTLFCSPLTIRKAVKNTLPNCSETSLIFLALS